jgi:hypothetical protein
MSWSTIRLLQTTHAKSITSYYSCLRGYEEGEQLHLRQTVQSLQIEHLGIGGVPTKLHYTYDHDHHDNHKNDNGKPNGWAVVFYHSAFKAFSLLRPAHNILAAAL